MEDLMPAIIIIVSTVIGIISSSKKEQEKKAAEARRAEAARARVENARKAQQAPAPAQPVAMMPTMPTAAAPHQVATPKVHVHLDPAIVSHDMSGSMASPHTEGVDPCHEEQMHPRTTLPDAPEPVSGISLEWSGENMVKAFVMQELLKRPQERRAR